LQLPPWSHPAHRPAPYPAGRRRHGALAVFALKDERNDAGADFLFLAVDKAAKIFCRDALDRATDEGGAVDDLSRWCCAA
jgi:hypothetical protein